MQNFHNAEMKYSVLLLTHMYCNFGFDECTFILSYSSVAVGLHELYVTGFFSPPTVTNY